jgi:ATP-dependent RNA helicase DeaD
MENFQELGLPPGLMRSLEQMGFNIPTPVQAQAIPPAMLGKDILGSAQTGTGKTGAFGIPLVNKLMTNQRGAALILLPTRELAVQVIEQLEKMIGKHSIIKTALLIGGESMPRQIDQLRQRPRVIVGTPGRIIDHLERGTLMLHDANFLVLDETDRMLDMGFGIQLEKIFKFLPAVRQTLMFSATLPDNIIKISEKYLKEPVRVSVGSMVTPAAKIKQETVHTSEADKYNRLIAELNAREGSILVFIKTKWGAEKMAIRLRKEKHNAEAIHGDLRQNKRDKVIQNFREMKSRILIATDIAARGLDIPHIEHVINYDLPQCPEDYIHRVGRTARAGAEGSALNLLTPQDGEKWFAIQKLINPKEAGKYAPAHNDNGQQNRKPGAGGKRKFRGNRNNKRKGGGGFSGGAPKRAA